MDPDKEKAISDLAAEVRDEPSKASDTSSASASGLQREPAPIEEPTPQNQEQGNNGSGEYPPPTSRPSSQPSAGSGKVLGMLALALAIIACFGSAYIWYQLEVQQKHERQMAEAGLLGELKGVSESTRALEKAQDKLSAEQNQLTLLIQEKLEGSVAKLSQQQEELTDSVSKIYESMDRSIDSWALEEVEQLLRMANHSVALAGDTQMAATGLGLADKRLSELGNPDYLSIRRLIADEITRLSSVQRVDIPGLALRLSALSTAVDDLPLAAKAERSINDAAGAAPPGDQTDNMWMEAGQALLSDLKGLVRIQNVTEAAKPLLTPEQRYFLLANLRLKLSAAQLAALRSDSETYNSSIEESISWLSEYFDAESSAVQGMIGELQSMVGQNLAPTRPDISGSIDELQAIKSRMKSE